MADKLKIARDRFQAAKHAWQERFDDAREDFRMVYADQWESSLRAARENAGRPAMQFNVIAQDINRAANSTRQNRPGIKVTAGDKVASESAATFLEDKIRHIQYASEASVAYDTAEECALAGGFGYLRLKNEYVDDGDISGEPSVTMFDQEPRIKRIRDPFTVYYDPDCEEADFSDARFCFVRIRIPRAEFKSRFKREPVPWDQADGEMSGDRGWGNDEDNVWIAEYWEVEKSKRTLVQLNDGTVAWKDEAPDGADVIAERDVEGSTVYMSLIDGRNFLEERKEQDTDRYIPIFPCLGKEAVVDGKVILKSMTRDARDPQKFLNGTKSGIAENIAVTSRPFWTGPKGTFKKTWDDPKLNVPYREWDMVIGPNGQVAPGPELVRPEAPIQALMQTAMAARDDVRMACGYFDAVLQPSKAANLSALAVEKRTDQTDLTNFHFEDNLARTQWHLGRALVYKLLKTIDTPRTLKGRRENGDTYDQHIAVKDADGNLQKVPGHENEPHITLEGRFDVTVQTGPSYDTKLDEETEGLLEAMQADPMLWQYYADVLFELKGWPELVERAKMILPPSLQQAIQAKKQGQDPVAQQQMAQVNAQLMQSKQIIARLIQVVQQKQIEGQTKLNVEKLKTIGNIMVEQMKHSHDAAKHVLSEKTDAIDQITSLLNESELGATPGPGMGNNAQPTLPGDQAAPQGAIA